MNAQGNEIFPRSCVSTLESWIRDLYRKHEAPLPSSVEGEDLDQWKRRLALGALSFAAQGRFPQLDTLFIDEVQDLLDVEVELLAQWSLVLFCVGDDRQRIYNHTSGIEELRKLQPAVDEHILPFHYRLAPEICQMADRIMTAQGGKSLAATEHYAGPTPGRIEVAGSLPRVDQMSRAAGKLRDQIRVYADFIRDGDRLGIVVPRTRDRQTVYDYLQDDPNLNGKSQIIKARSQGDRGHSSEFDGSIPICILTVQGCKGLEFRSLHWLFCDDLSWHHNAEHYYTVVTRAKTSLDLYYENALPQDLARSCAPVAPNIW